VVCDILETLAETIVVYFAKHNAENLRISNFCSTAAICFPIYYWVMVYIP
jgi:hypothetical protein